MGDENKPEKGPDARVDWFIARVGIA